MRWLDWVIVGAYLVYVITDGLRLTKKSKELEGYFLANRSLPWWAVGLSVMATQLSAITMVGTTGQAYASGMGFIQFYFALPFAMIVLCMTVVPFFYRAKVYTAYEYLERRFDAKTRVLTGFFFLLSRGLSCGVIIAAPALILTKVFGMNELATVLLIGVSTTIYTVFGGVQAVAWTDVKQMVVIFVGFGVLLYIIIAGLPQEVSMHESLSLAAVTGKLKAIDTSFDLNQTYTLWSGLLGSFFLFLSYFGCDQSQVQRFLTAKSVSQSRSSLLMSAFVKIPMQFFILFIGVMIFVFYQFHKPPLIFKSDDRAKVENTAEYKRLNQDYNRVFEHRRQAAMSYAQSDGMVEMAEPSREIYAAADAKIKSIRSEAGELVKKTTGETKWNDVNYIFPTFVLEHAPVGVIGLIIAAIFAAAMSSIAAELSALSATTVIDFYKRLYIQDAPDAHYLNVSKLATCFWGLFACGVAFYAGRLGSLIEVVNTFGSWFYGSLLGVFVLAIGTKRATSNGAFIGLLAGMVAVAIVGMTTKISFLWYNLVGCVVVVVVGMIISSFDKKAQRLDSRTNTI